MKTVTRFLTDETGATAIEYALIASLIAIALITGARLVGSSLNVVFSKISTKISVN